LCLSLSFQIPLNGHDLHYIFLGLKKKKKEEKRTKKKEEKRIKKKIIVKKKVLFETKYPFIYHHLKKYN
jgi:hypothetical protein